MKKIRGIGFSEEHDFTIKRNDFQNLIVEIPPIEEPDDQIYWEQEMREISVISPNWRPTGRKWLATLNNDKEAYFSIDDNLFWDHIKLHDINTKIEDQMTVQWARPTNRGTRSGYKVLRVLEFNGRKLSEPLKGDELKHVLENLIESDAPDEDAPQMDLPLGSGDEG